MGVCVPKLHPHEPDELPGVHVQAMGTVTSSVRPTLSLRASRLICLPARVSRSFEVGASGPGNAHQPVFQSLSR